MSSEDPERTRPEDPEADHYTDEDDGPPPTPFDHPYFLPVLLAAGAVWFGYDGFFNPAMKDHLWFNRIGFGVLLVLTIRYGLLAKRELDAERQDPDDRKI